jgi:hypothetical protein
VLTLVFGLALLAVGLGVMLAVMGRAPAGAAVRADGATRLPPPPAVDPAELEALLPRDAEPRGPTEKIVLWKERVLGLRLAGRARAYPYQAPAEAPRRTRSAEHTPAS